MREDNYWSHFANGTAEWQRAFNDPPPPPPTLWIPRALVKHIPMVALWRQGSAVKMTNWFQLQRFCSCRSDYLGFVIRLHLLTSSSNNSHIYFLGLSYHLPAAHLIIIFFYLSDNVSVSYVPSTSPLVPNFLFHQHHYLWLSVATSSAYNVTTHFPDSKNLSQNPTTWCQVSYISSLVTSVIRVSLLNVISLMGKWKRVIFNVFYFFLYI